MSDELEQETEELETEEAVEESTEETTSEEVKEETQEKSPDNYLDFTQETLDTKRVQARIKSDTKLKYQKDAEIQKLQDKIAKFENDLHETKKPKEVAAPEADLAYTDPDAFLKQSQANLQAQQDQQAWEQQQATIAAATQQVQAQRQQNIELQFLEKGKANGYTADQLNKSYYGAAEELLQLPVEEHGRAKDFLDSLLVHDEGDRLLDHLSRKPNELREIVRLSDRQSGYRLAQIAESIKQQSFKSKAPDPDETLKGAGAPIKEDGPDGATYE